MACQAAPAERPAADRATTARRSSTAPAADRPADAPPARQVRAAAGHVGVDPVGPAREMEAGRAVEETARALAADHAAAATATTAEFVRAMVRAATAALTAARGRALVAVRAAVILRIVRT